MRTVLAIARKELIVYLTTPWAWVVFTFMAFLSSFFFVGSIGQFMQMHEYAAQVGWERLGPEAAQYRNLTDGVALNVLGSDLVVVLFVAPFLSMRLFAEERRQKTFELLMTTPVRASEIVLGKYLGGVGIMTCTLVVTFFYPLLLTRLGSSESGSALEWSTIGLSYVALLLWGSTVMALGLFISSLTESQMVAAMVSFVIALVWMMLKFVASNADEPFRTVLNYISFDTQFQNLLRGVLDLKPFAFFLSFIATCLLLTHRSVEAQRWT